MKDETAREIVRRLADDELPMPAWNRVSLRASFEDEIATRRAPYRRLPWVELAVRSGVGITLSALAIWGIFALGA